MAFGVYVHIPYCLQRCVYCDFATYEKSQILAPDLYVQRVIKEITLKGPEVGPQPLDTLYFGGGTPSLLEPAQLIEIVDALKANGFIPKNSAEITLEINPATLTPQKLDALMKSGFNRFSVGAQSFNDDLLKIAHRKHSAQDTRDTLSLLKKNAMNYSLDILFALPTQTIDDLNRDLNEAAKFDPPHVSPYCLTVPESNPMWKNRPHDDDQVKMFEIIEKALTQTGLERYEISNFAKPGFESRHNLLYWEDDEYWGIGLSSHSYLKRFQWGTRFWNTRSINDFIKEIDELRPAQWNLGKIDEAHGEVLEEHQALTDFFHTSLRTTRGLSLTKFEEKFKKPLNTVASHQMQKLKSQGFIQEKGDFISLTPQGVVLSNQVYGELTFLKTPGIDKKGH